jgi:hypothetical protein
MIRDPHESFWTYKADSPTPTDSPYGWPREEWEKLSSGYRREIQRGFEREQARKVQP